MAGLGTSIRIFRASRLNSSRRRGHQAGECLLVPVDEVPLRRFALHKFLPAARLLLLQQQILDGVRRGLRDHPAHIVETLPPRASADLMKVARTEDAGFLPAEFAELREKHRADRHIDPDPQRIRAADHFEQPSLRQLLGQHAVFRQQSGVVQADPVAQPLNSKAKAAANIQPHDRYHFFIAGPREHPRVAWTA